MSFIFSSTFFTGVSELESPEEISEPGQTSTVITRPIFTHYASHVMMIPKEELVDCQANEIFMFKLLHSILSISLALSFLLNKQFEIPYLLQKTKVLM